MGDATQAGERVDRLPILEGQHASMVLVDVERYGDPARTDNDQLQVRSGLYGVLEPAFDGAGILWSRCDIGDRGDGVMALVPADVSKNRLVTRLPELLVAGIEAHNAAASRPLARFRLRMALHAGEVHHDEHGPTSDSLNFAFRLLESAEGRNALAASPGVLVMIVSDLLYRGVVRHDPAASPQSYRPVRFVAKETSALAWIRCPGDPSLPAPNGKSASQVEAPEDRLTRILRTQEAHPPGVRQSALTMLVDRLLAIPTVAQESTRRLVIDHLRPEIANAVPYFAQARHHVFSLVRTCMNYPGGVEELLSVIHLLEGDSTPIHLLDQTVAQLLAHPRD